MVHRGTVKRLNLAGQTVTMSRGTSRESWPEPKFKAIVYNVRGRRIAEVSNSSILCLPGGSVRAPEATDQQILDAVLGDESVF